MARVTMSVAIPITKHRGKGNTQHKCKCKEKVAVHGRVLRFGIILVLADCTRLMYD